MIRTAIRKARLHDAPADAVCARPPLFQKATDPGSGVVLKHEKWEASVRRFLKKGRLVLDRIRLRPDCRTNLLRSLGKEEVLEDALRDTDHIYATLEGIGLSNDIGGSLFSPDSEGQLRAMRAAYAQAGWSPASVDLVECHGTGTLVGDEVEFSSLKSMWAEADAAHQACVIGSVKSNVGHLLTAAGSAGLIKVLMAMKHGVLPPTAPQPGQLRRSWRNG